MAQTPLTTQQAVNLTKMYEDAERDILKELNAALLKPEDRKYLLGMQRNVQSILTDLNKGSRKWCEDAIPSYYTSGMRVIDGELAKVGLRAYGGFGAIHQQAAQVLADNAYGRMQDVTQLIGRRTDDIYRTMAMNQARSSVIGYATIDKVAENLKEDLAKKGVTGFVDKAGHEWNMSTYADMVAQTTTHEAFIQGTTNRLLENDLDLVEVTSHPGACSDCIPFEGAHLSLAGLTPGYETLEEAKARGFLHPRCGHTFSAYMNIDEEIAKLEAEEEAAMATQLKSKSPSKGVSAPTVADGLKMARADGTASMEVTSTMKRYLEDVFLGVQSLDGVAANVSKSGFEEIRRVYNRFQKNPVWREYLELELQSSVGIRPYSLDDLKDLFSMLNNKAPKAVHEANYLFLAQEFVQTTGENAFLMEDFQFWLQKKGIAPKELRSLLDKAEDAIPGFLRSEIDDASGDTIYYMERKAIKVPTTVVEEMLVPPMFEVSEVQMNILNTNTNKDLQKLLKKTPTMKNTVITSDAIKHLDAKAFRESVAGIQRVMERYPKLRGALDSISLSQSAGGLMECSFNGKVIRIGFDKDSFSDYKKAHKLNTTVKDGVHYDTYHPRSETLDSSAIHEMGHAIEARLILEEYPDSGAFTEAMRATIWSKGTIPKEIVGKAVTAVKRSPEGKWPSGLAKTAADLREEVSGYALTNTSETMAEAVSDFFSNGENAAPLSKAIMREIDRRLL